MGVTLVGQEGVVLSGNEYGSDPHTATLVVQTEGVSFDSMYFPQGAVISEGGSVTMTKCTSTGLTTCPMPGARLIMEDWRIFGISSLFAGTGLRCEGDVKATRCIFEENQLSGVFVYGSSHGWWTT